MEAETANVQRPRLSYILLLAANMTWIFGVFLYSNFIGLYMREELGANSVQVGYWSTVFLLSMLLFTGLGGLFTARFGEKLAMILSWLVIIPAPIIYFFAVSWQMTLIGAFLEGASMLAAAPIGAYITTVSGGGKRGRAFGLSSASIALGGIPSPVLGGLVVTLFGYQVLFLLATGFFAISTLLVIPMSPIQSTREERSERRSWKFLKNHVFTALTLFWFTVSTIFWIVNMFVPLFLFDRWGLTEAQIGALGSITNASGTVLGPLMGWVGDRWSYVGALVFTVLGTFGFYGFLTLNHSVVFLPFIYAISGFIHTFSLLSAFASHHIPRGQLPDAIAAYNLLGRSFSPLSPIIGGIAFAMSPALPLILASILIPLPLLLLFFLFLADRRSKRQREPQKEEPVPSPIEEMHPGL